MEVIDRHIKEMCDQIQADRFKAALGLNREGFNHMTITAENTTQTVTLDTQDGTVLRLIDGNQTLANEGALAVVDRTLDTDQSRFLPVSWLKGHELNGMSQMNGGYDPETFEVCEFQIGDRVRVTGSQYEFGYEGVIESMPATNGDDCIVAIDFPHTARLSYLLDRLVKVDRPDPLKEMRDGLMRAFGFDPEPVVEDDEPEEEPLAEWEKELLYGPRFSVDDVLVLNPSGERAESHGHWSGLRVTVKRDDEGSTSIFVKPLDERPDGYGLSPFFWEREDFRPFDVADFRVGDIVEGRNLVHGDEGEVPTGTVTRLEGDFGGEFEINWTSGPACLVNSGPLGYSRKPATLVGVAPKPEAEFAVGDTVTVAGNAVSGHYLRIGSQAEVEAVTYIEDGPNAGKYEYRVGGIEDYEGTPLTQFLVSDDVAVYVPEPEFEDFTFEAGQEIASSDVLDDLPMGTVVIVNGDEASPSIKLGSNEFGRLNRWNSSGKGQPISYFMRGEVEQAADGGGSLVIGYVPTV